MNLRTQLRMGSTISVLALGAVVACSSANGPGDQGGEEGAGQATQAEQAASPPVAVQPGVPVAPRGVTPVIPAAGAPPLGSNYCSQFVSPGAKPHLTYYGGQLISNPKVVNVNWSSNVAANVASSMGQFYTDILNSTYVDWLSEYNSVGVNGADGQPGSNQGIARGTLKLTKTITPAKCPGTAATCTLTDSDIQTEIKNQIAAGNLPAPETGCSGFSDTIYMINFPPKVSINSTIAGGTSCTSFCGFHASFKYGANNLVVPYSVLPDVSVGTCAKNCTDATLNLTYLQNATTIASHELFEAATDTDVADVTGNSYARPAGWGDNTCGEIGDICAYQYGTVSVSGRTWEVQQQWSNAANDCVVTRTAPPICTGANTPAGCRPCSCSDNAINCTGGTPWCETTSSNIKYGECVQCVTDSECSSGQTCQKTSVTSTDDTCNTPCGAAGQACCSGNTCNAPGVCAGGTCCTPATACPAGDVCGSVSDGCGGQVQCGSCTGAQDACVANKCVCQPKTACGAGQVCGTIPDGCGATVSCGMCTGAQDACVGNQCVCQPKTACGAGQVCGTIPDGCGATVSCGSCTGAQDACVGNQCVCQPKTACGAGQVCGTIPDGCGATVSCGSCSATQTCTNNACVDNPVDAGVDSGSTGTDSGTTGTDSGTTGTDSGTTGTDSGTTGSDSGTTGSDSGTVDTDSGMVDTDSGTVDTDAGTTGTDAGTTPHDAGTARDASTKKDAASAADAADDGGDTSGTGDNGGCGCRTAQPKSDGPSSALLGFGALAMIGGLRLRRRRSARK